MSVRRQEVMRRLGHPRFRHVCPICRRYVAAVYQIHVWDQGAPEGVRPALACDECRKRVDEQNRVDMRRRVQNEVHLKIANIEHFASSERSSNHEYLAACARMRREMGIG